MRLVDADKLKMELQDCMFNDNMMNPLMRYTDILEIIDTQPTVYDIDKVVEELETARADYSGDFQCDVAYGLRLAIEIVKKVGEDNE